MVNSTPPSTAAPTPDQHPDSVEALWQLFAVRAIPKSAPLDQRMMAKTVFFSGCAAMFNLIFQSLVRFEGEDVHVETVVIESLLQELQAWQTTMGGGDSVLRVN